ncbi:hypothetical protein BRC97_09920 [Halobacteriales archaeon QS_6_71_20]|nr:MAG: hypothetical protein BRC97_09920 [Halobacteriales archaeon QS_6_71_20]
MSPDFGWEGADDESSEEQSTSEPEVTSASLEDEPEGADEEAHDTPEASESVGASNWLKIRKGYADDDTDTREARQDAVEQLRDEHNLVPLQESDELYRYDPTTGIYRDDGESVVRTTLEDGLGRYNRRGESNEIVYKLQQQTTVELDDFGPEDRVCVANGVLDVTNPSNPTLRSHSPDHLFLRHQPMEYDRDAECPRFEEFLSEAVPEEDRPKLQEYVGYTVFHHWNMKFQHALLILGPQASGKSTFLNTITELLGAENVAHQSVQRLANNRFATAKLVGKLANVRNDLDSSLVKYTGRFKELTAGDPLPAEEKYKSSYFFRPTQKYLFAANQAPRVKDADDAFYRRWLHVEFPHTVPESDRNPDLEDELKEELPGILNWALEGYRRLLTNDGFTNEQSTDEKRAHWMANGDSIQQFVENGPVKLDPNDETAKDMVYAAYRDWCNDRGLSPKTKSVFSRKLNQKYDIEGSYPTVNGGRVYCYNGLSLTTSTEEIEPEGAK